MTRKSILVIAAAALLALTSCAGGKTGFPKIDQKGKTAIVAHRGYWNCEAAGFAENSIASLKAAQDNAAGAIIGSKFVTLLSEAYAAVGGGTADHAKIADTALDKLFDALSK